MRSTDWVSSGSRLTNGLPRLPFPVAGDMPDVYAPETTLLLTADGGQVHAYLWCYLERELLGTWHRFNPASLSSRRVQDLPMAIQRLSRRARFENSRPSSMHSELKRFGTFMGWLDAPVHQGRYEAVLSDQTLALEAIKRHHTYLRQRMQANHAEGRISAAMASHLDATAVRLMSAIHDRDFGNEVELIKFIHGDGVKAPKADDVAAFMACMQGVFDSVVAIVFRAGIDSHDDASPSKLRWQSGGRETSIPVSPSVDQARVMELGCMAYAALCAGDSGANLAALRSYEEPEDIQEQLDSPERVNLRQKIIKFRAGGKHVPVHLTSTTVTRLRSYLCLREALRSQLDSHDVGALFVQCEYGVVRYRSVPALGIMPLGRNFTSDLRARFDSFGIELPSVTMQQLRSYKAGKLAVDHNPKVAADMMGNSVTTAIRRYSKITETESRAEMAPFLASLTSVVLTRAEGNTQPGQLVIPITAIPAGGCADHGHPKAQSEAPLVAPDCTKTEGCFFCDKFHVHADEEDSIKLLSCRSVLERLAPRAGDAGPAARVHAAVVDRINALLGAIKRINPTSHDRAHSVVIEEGRLSRYWASKLQQLHLLGLLSRSHS